jgi:hypothetical protein
MITGGTQCNDQNPHTTVNMPEETTMPTHRLAVLLAALPMLVSCVMAPVPGSAPAATPPQLLKSDDGLIWNDATLFGPIPAQLQQNGDKVCRRIGYERAIGYHPKAKDKNGKTMKGGGYYCTGKLTE